MTKPNVIDDENSEKSHSDSPPANNANKASKAAASKSKSKQTKRSRKVKFADPVVDLRLYDRTASPNTQMELAEPRPKASTSTLAHSGPLSDLGPPLSLVAQLDVAARKMNARVSNTGSKIGEEPKNSKSLKSHRSGASIKSSFSGPAKGSISPSSPKKHD